VRVLREQLNQFLEYDSKRDRDLRLILDSYSTRIFEYEAENRSLRKEVKDLKDLGPPAKGKTSLSSRDIDRLARDVYAKFDWDKVASQSDLDSLKRSTAADPVLVAKVEAVHKELNDPAGLFTVLSDDAGSQQG
jgi:hypothetical protein